MLSKITNDKKKGISESDMYQMVTYAIRNNVTDIKLLYPSTVQDNDEEPIEFKIEDELAEKAQINIHAHKLPVIADNWQNMDMDKGLSEGFDDATELLIKKLNSTLRL
jgi:5-methylcytosine-specific restriction enzyme subunit McrC